VVPARGSISQCSCPTKRLWLPAPSLAGLRSPAGARLPGQVGDGPLQANDVGIPAAVRLTRHSPRATAGPELGRGGTLDQPLAPHRQARDDAAWHCTRNRSPPWFNRAAQPTTCAHPGTLLNRPATSPIGPPDTARPTYVAALSSTRQRFYKASREGCGCPDIVERTEATAFRFQSGEHRRCMLQLSSVWAAPPWAAAGACTHYWLLGPPGTPGALWPPIPTASSRLQSGRRPGGRAWLFVPELRAPLTTGGCRRTSRSAWGLRHSCTGQTASRAHTWWKGSVRPCRRGGP